METRRTCQAEPEVVVGSVATVAVEQGPEVFLQYKRVRQ